MSEKNEIIKNTEEYEELVENYNNITALMKKNEKLLENIGFNLDEKDEKYIQDREIKFPSDNTRTLLSRKLEKELSAIIVIDKCNRIENNIHKNCLYKVALMDVYNCLLIKFGALKKVTYEIYKEGLINLFYIIKVVVIRGTKKYASKCTNCPKRKFCNKKIISDELIKKDRKSNNVDLSFLEYVELLEKKDFLIRSSCVFDEYNGEENIYDKLKTYKSIQNYVNCTEGRANKKHYDRFNLYNYNECSLLLGSVVGDFFIRILDQESCDCNI